MPTARLSARRMRCGPCSRLCRARPAIFSDVLSLGPGDDFRMVIRRRNPSPRNRPEALPAPVALSLPSPMRSPARTLAEVRGYELCELMIIAAVAQQYL